MNDNSRGFFGERPLPEFVVDPQVLRRHTRRDALLFGAGTVAALASARLLLPNAIRIDDEVAESLYSPRRTVPTYAKTQITPPKNNYNGATPRSWVYSWMASDFGWAGFRRERRPRYSQSPDSLLDTRADYATGLRRRLECDRLVGWCQIR